MTNQEVINAFAAGKAAKSSNGNLQSDGRRLWSYSTVIAQRINNGRFIVNITRYSVSTSKVQTYTVRTLPASRCREVSGLPRGTYDLTAARA